MDTIKLLTAKLNQPVKTFLMVLAIVTIAVFFVDAFSCHIGRDDPEVLKARIKELKEKVRQQKNATP